MNPWKWAFWWRIRYPFRWNYPRLPSATFLCFRSRSCYLVLFHQDFLMEFADENRCWICIACWVWELTYQRRYLIFGYCSGSWWNGSHFLVPLVYEHIWLFFFQGAPSVVTETISSWIYLIFTPSSSPSAEIVPGASCQLAFCPWNETHIVSVSIRFPLKFLCIDPLHGTAWEERDLAIFWPMCISSILMPLTSRVFRWR